MEEKVFERLKFSYERLKSSAQPCFLYCALYPKDHHIETKELIEYWMWEGLLGNVRWIEDTTQQGEEILEELKDLSLLESIGQEGGIEQVKMHALIRDMAIHITKTSPRFLINAGLGHGKHTFDEDWPEDLNRASLMRNDMREIETDRPNCPNLFSLLLQFNSLDGRFCHDFFHSMANLKVLDLSCTGVHTLPNSLSGLKNLRALFLRNCWNLISLPSLSKLDALMVLDLSNTRVEELPQGMDKLISLKRLDLSHTRVQMFPPGLVSAFKYLQELLADGCGFLWGLESPDPGMGACIEELKSLPDLVILEVNFCNTEVFHEYINSGHWYQLKRFKFCVGGLYTGKSGKNSLAFIGEFLVNGNPILLPKHTSELRVMRCDDITRLIVPSLEYLKIVYVSDCARIKYLFKHGMLHHLPNLEEIAIESCPNMVNVIEQEEVDHNAAVITFPKLQKLILFGVTNLKSIYNGVVLCDSLQTIVVRNCNKLKRFPVMVHIDDEQKLLSPHGLKEVRGERAWLERLEYDLPNAKTVVQHLFIEESAPDEQPTRVRVMSPLRSSSRTASFAGNTEMASVQVIEPGNCRVIMLNGAIIKVGAITITNGKALMETSSKGTAVMETGSSSGTATMEASSNGTAKMEPGNSDGTTGLDPSSRSRFAHE